MTLKQIFRDHWTDKPVAPDDQQWDYHLHGVTLNEDQEFPGLPSSPLWLIQWRWVRHSAAVMRNWNADQRYQNWFRSSSLRYRGVENKSLDRSVLKYQSDLWHKWKVEPYELGQVEGISNFTSLWTPDYPYSDVDYPRLGSWFVLTATSILLYAKWESTPESYYSDTGESHPYLQQVEYRSAYALRCAHTCEKFYRSPLA